MSKHRLLLVALSLCSLLSQTEAQQFTTFVNRAQQAGVFNLSFGRATAMVDLDQDGLLDLICCDAEEENQFYRQLPGGQFADANTLWNVPTEPYFTWGVLATDFDGDGDTDVYLVNGGTIPGGSDGSSGPQPNRMLRNDISTTGALTDFSSATGDALQVDECFGGSVLDYDLDGMLDIFLTKKNEVNTLLHNDGGLAFTDVSTAAGIFEVGDWHHSGVGDYDNDGWFDIGVGNTKGANLLYHNQGDGTFVDRAAEAGAEGLPGQNFGMVFQDFNNDGWLDLFVAKYQFVPTSPSLVLLNNRDGTFRDVSPGSGIGSHTDMGHDSEDFDNDGFPDLFMGTGNPSFQDFDYLYKVTPEGNGLLIQDVSVASGINAAGQTRMHGMAAGDLDGDGDVDVFCNNGGPSDLPNTLEGSFLWINTGNGNNWTSIELQGVRSNRAGVGARAKAMTDAGRDVHRMLAVGRGFANTPSPRLTFGLGRDTAVDRIEITWPSGIVQPLDQPLLGTRTTVVETGMLLEGTPAIGSTFDLNAVGPAGDLVQVGLSAGTDSLELPTVNGTFGLADPYLLLPILPLNAAGELTLTLPVPNLLALVGQTFYTQAWIPDATGQGTLSQVIPFTIQ